MAMTSWQLPTEVLSSRYTVTINGRDVPVLHASLNLHCANVDIDEPVEVVVTAPDHDYWTDGVVVRPLSLGIKAVVRDRAVHFTLPRPMKVSIERNRALAFDDEVLFLFANAPQQGRPDPSDPDVVFLGAGLHRQDIDLTSGKTLYLDGGAVLMGSVNIWDAKNVAIAGRGYVIYDGPQNPAADQGGWARKNWRVLAMQNCDGVRVSGITCIARSRTWTVLAGRSRNLEFSNVKVVSANPANINNDGFNLSACQVRIDDCFLRTSDDCISSGVGLAGESRDFLVTGTTFWPSFANVLRVGYYQHNLKVDGWMVRDCDVIHMFDEEHYPNHGALLAMVESSDSVQNYRNVKVENVRMEDGGALCCVNLPGGSASDIVLKDIAVAKILQNPGTITGAGVSDLTFDNLTCEGRSIDSEADSFMSIRCAPGAVRFIAGKNRQAIDPGGLITELSLIEEFKPSRGNEFSQGRIGIQLTNTSKQPVKGEFRLKVGPTDGTQTHCGTPADRCRCIDSLVIAYDLKTGETSLHQKAIELRCGAYVVMVPRQSMDIRSSSVRVSVPFQIGRSAKDLTLDSMDVFFSGHPSVSLSDNGTALASFRLMLAGDDLALRAEVTDASPAAGPSPWEGSDIEIYGAMRDSEGLGHICLIPAIAGAKAYGVNLIGNKPVTDPRIRVSSEPSASGYVLQALIPLEYLTVTPGTEEFFLECQVSTTPPAGAPRRQYIGAPRRQYTLFGSGRPHADNSAYARIVVQPEIQ